MMSELEEGGMTKIVTDDMSAFIVEDAARKATESHHLMYKDVPSTRLTVTRETAIKLVLGLTTIILFGTWMYFM